MALNITPFLEKLELEGAARGTVLFYAAPLKKFAAHCPKSLEEITADDVYAFARGIENDYSRHNAIRAVKYFLKISGMNVSVKLPKFCAPAPDEYTADETTKLFAVATDEEKRLFKFYQMLGVREGEAMHARWENLQDSTYTVKPVGGWAPKKHKSRTVSVPDALANLLAPVRQSSGWIFPTAAGQPDGHHLRKLQALAKRAGLPCGSCNLQKFRRSYATTMLRTGATIHEVAQFLGHSNLDTVLRYLALANAGSARVKGLANSAFGS